MSQGTYAPPSSQRNAQGDNYLYSGLENPTVTAIDAPRGSVFFQVARKIAQPIGVFHKLDNGLTTNWAQIFPLTAPIKPVCPFTVTPAVGIGDVVYISGPSTVDEAIASLVAKKYAIGVCIGLPGGGIGDIQVFGETPAIFSGLVVGLPVFLSPITLGGVTQTPPLSGSGHWLQILGIAATDKSIHLQIEDPKKRI